MGRGSKYYDSTQQAHLKRHAPPPPPLPHKIVTRDLGMKLTDIDMNELVWAINKLKRGKAAGPDCLPIDRYKEMNTIQLQPVMQMLNSWWNGGTIPDEAKQAQVK